MPRRVRTTPSISSSRDDSCYLCVKDGNKNHPLTDTAWWKCIARGTQATEAAKTALAEANKAIEATRNAISAAVC